MGDALWMVEYWGGLTLGLGIILVFWGGVRLCAPPTPLLERGKIWPILGQLNVFRPFSRMVQVPATKNKNVVLAQKTPENSTKTTENRSDTVKGAQKHNGTDL